MREVFEGLKLKGKEYVFDKTPEEPFIESDED
jgi:hypothetical protein